MIDIKNMTIAIVDDAEKMCKMIRGMLKILEIGNTFYYGANGKQALEIVREHVVDLLIMDWNMPVMDGLEALGYIREDENLRDLPVVMVTGEASREMVAAAGESDINAYILKPMNAKSLGDKIRDVVDRVNNPAPMFVHLKAARVLKEAGDLNGATNELENARKADPTSSKPLRELGILYFEQGDLASAEEFLLNASEMNPYDVFAFNCLGELYLKKNNIDRAVRCFEQAMQVSPRNITRGINFGKALVKKRILGKAAKVFDKALALSDNDASLQEEVADFCMENDAPEYAIQLFKAILLKESGRTDILMKLGVILERTNEHLEAAKYFLEAGKKESENMEFKFHLADCYLAVQQLFRAEQVLRNILEIDPENGRAREMIKKIT